MKFQHYLILIISMHCTAFTSYKEAAQTLKIEAFKEEIKRLPDCQKQKIADQLPDWLLSCSDSDLYVSFVQACAFPHINPDLLLKKTAEWQKFDAFKKMIQHFSWQHQAAILIARLNQEMKDPNTDRKALLEEILKNVASVV